MAVAYSQKVLVVDDSSFMRKIVVHAVKGAGFANVIEAEDGGEAIKMYEKEKPDIMLMDLIMPNVTGLEVLKTLVPQGAKIIVISAIGQKQIIEDAFKFGACGYFIKPFFAESEIKVMIESVLRGEIVRPEADTTTYLNEYIEVAQQGAEKSAVALSTILGKAVAVVTSGVMMTSVTDKLKELHEHKERTVTAVTGLLIEVPGATYISIQDTDAFSLVDMLNKKETGTTTSLGGEIERSTIEEVLNILSNSYLSVFGDLHTDMLAAELPYVIERNELRTYVEKFLNRKGTHTDDIVVFNSTLEIAEHSLRIQLEFVTYNDELA